MNFRPLHLSKTWGTYNRSRTCSNVLHSLFSLDKGPVLALMLPILAHCPLHLRAWTFFVEARKNERMAARMCLVCQLCRTCFRKIWSIIVFSEKTSTDIRPNSNEIDLVWWDDDSDHLLRRLLMQCCHSIHLNLPVGYLSSLPPAFKAYPKKKL